jgi:predicted metal-binding protein
LPYLEIEFKNIVFDKKVQTYCINSYFKCPSYGHSWACPPEAPYLEQEISKYNTYYLIFVKFNLREFIEREKLKHPEKNETNVRNVFFMNNFLRENLEEEILLFINGQDNLYDEKLILWDGFCRICSNEKDKGCNYDTGDPCRYPDKKRYSMEAVGIDVTQTVRNLNFNIEWPPIEYVYRFGLVCFK